MSVQTTASRPAGKSVGAAMCGLALTLVIFVAVSLAFLIAPLLLLGAALVGYLVFRPRSDLRSPRSRASSGVSHHGFGAGAR